MWRNAGRLASLLGCLLARRCHGAATAPQIAALGACVDVVDGRGGSLHALSGEETGADLSAPLWLVDKASGGVAVLGASLNSEERRRVCEAVHARAPASRPARGPRARLPRGEAAEAGRLLTRPCSLNVGTANVPTAPEDRLAYGGLCAPTASMQARHRPQASGASGRSGSVDRT